MSRDRSVDVAKAAAMAGVVAVHSAASFAETPIGWAVTDASTSIAADASLWIGRSFLMPVFFLVAGVLSARTLEARGVREFAKSRFFRLAVPLAVLVVPISMAMNGLWDWGRQVTLRADVADAVPQLEASEHAVTLAHLWFLYYLILFSLVGVAVHAALKRRQVPVAAAVAGLLAIASAALVVAGKLQLDQPLGFAIDPLFASYYGAFFIAGLVLAERATAVFRRLLPFAALLAAASFGAVLPTLLRSRGEIIEPGALALVGSAVFSVSLTCSVVGLCAHLANWGRGVVRAASDATYFIYVAHLPLVVLLQIAAAKTSLAGPLEWVLISLVSYSVCFSFFWLARFMIGPMTPRTVR